MLTTSARRAALLFAVLASTVATMLVAVPGPASAVTITPEVPTLPQGSAPALPYVDVPAKEIVDGSKRVDLTGLKGKVSQLYKVDGGYLIGRRKQSTAPDLVFVSSGGKRTLITTRWYAPECDCVPTFALVDSSGGSVTFNRTKASAPDYADTLNVALPSLKIVRKRAFSHQPELFDQRAGSAYLGLDTRLLSWTPRTSALTTVYSGQSVQAADIGARTLVRRSNDGGGGQTVAPIPPRTGSTWAMDADGNVSSWSPDDTLLAGTGELIGEGTDEGVSVRQTSNGNSSLVVHGRAGAGLVWENASTLIIPARYEGTQQQNFDTRYQLIRCTLAGECQRIGPETTRPDDGYVVATRRGN